MTENGECTAWQESLSERADGAGRDCEQFERHLQSCVHCRERLEAYEALGERLRALPRDRAPEVVRNSVFEARGPGTLLPSRSSRRWAVAAVLLLTVGAAAWRLLGRSGEDVFPVYLDDHVSIVQARTASGLSASDPAALERWLGERLDFATPIPRWPWAEFTAARVCSLRGARISLLRLRIEGRDASLFVHPPLEPEVSASGTAARPAIHASRGYETACWKEGGLEYVLVAPALARAVVARLAER